MCSIPCTLDDIEQRYPGLVTLLWLFLGFLVGLRLRSRSKHTGHVCGASALLAVSGSPSRWGGSSNRRREDALCSLGEGVVYPHDCESGAQGEGHYVNAADV